MNYNQVAKDVIQACGGEKNIERAWHCVTRLRFTFVDIEKADFNKLRNIKGVMGTQYQRGQCQVVIGNEVNKVFAEISKLAKHAVEEGGGQKQAFSIINVVDAIITTIPTIFQPILPAIIGGGLMKGIMALLTAFNLIAPESGIYFILNIISDAPFYFLPFLLAASSAKRFNVNMAYALTLAGALMYPTILSGGDPIGFLGLQVPLANYSGSVLPVILGVWLLSYVERLVNKKLPSLFRLILNPIVILTISIPVLLIFIAPIGSYAGEILQSMFTWLMENTGVFGGLVAAGTMSVIVITGMHFAFFPGCIQALGTLGYDAFLTPMSLCSNLAQAGATFAVMFKTKNRDMKTVSFSSGISAIFGITEPAIYGVTMRLKKPFIAALIGGGLGGALFGWFGVKCFAFGMPGIAVLPSFISPDYPSNIMFALLGVGVSFIGGFIMTFLLGFDDIPNEEKDDDNKLIENRTPSKQIDIASPMIGKVIAMKDVNDATFAENIIGKGVAIRPSEGLVRAPFDGTVSMIAHTRHAIGLKSNDGIEILIHVGLETVALDGEHFEILVDTNQEVKQGTPLVKFDLKAILSKNIDITSPIIITNTQDYLDVIASNIDSVENDNTILLSIII